MWTQLACLSMALGVVTCSTVRRQNPTQRSRHLGPWQQHGCSGSGSLRVYAHSEWLSLSIPNDSQCPFVVRSTYRLPYDPNRAAPALGPTNSLRGHGYSFSRLAVAWLIESLRTGASAFRSCTRNRPKSDDECVSATIVSTFLEADIAAARTVQKAGEFDSRHATTLKDKKLELSAGAPPRSWSIEEECHCIVSHSDRKRKDPVPISSPLERLANVMRSWIMGIRAYFPLGLPITHADLAP
ncbi:hypothetical protein Landi51_11735 [Colletotrichum acutatum]